MAVVRRLGCLAGQSNRAICEPMGLQFADDTLALGTLDAERSMVRPLGIDPMHATCRESISTDNVSQNSAMHVGQQSIDTVVPERESLVVQSE